MNSKLLKKEAIEDNNTIFINKYDINLTNNSKKVYDEKGHEENILLKKIKELININELEYVSNNINKLLDLKFVNNCKCFNEVCKNRVKFAKFGDGYRAILYVRLSVEDGDLIDNDISKSLKNQILLLLDEARAKHWIIVGIFCDEDYSGADDERPEWKLLLRFSENMWTDIVLCKTQSRFTRSMEMVEKYLHNKFNDWNTRFVSIIDKTDTNDKSNKKSRQINGLVNEWALEDQSENTRKTLSSMKKNGQFTGSFAPYGYKKDPEDKYHLIIDEQAANVIKTVFEMYKKGKGYQNIARAMIEKKIPTPSQYKKLNGSKYICGQIRNLEKVTWSKDTIRKILMDETYIGTLVQGKVEGISYKNKKQRKIDKKNWIRVPNCHQAIIDMNTWKIVKQKFHCRFKPTVSGETHLFTGKVYCSCCGKIFHRNIFNTKQGKRAYLQCRTKASTAGMACSNGDSIKIDDLEEVILKQINKKINKYYDLDILQSEYYKKRLFINTEKQLASYIKEKEELLKKAETKGNVFSMLYEDRANSIITVDEFIILKKKYTAEISTYKERIVQIEDEVKSINNKQNNSIDKNKLFNKYKQIKKLDKIIINEFISKIIISKVNLETKKRTIKIIWNICAS